MKCAAQKQEVTLKKFEVKLEFEDEHEASIFLEMIATARRSSLGSSPPDGFRLIASKIEDTCRKAWSTTREATLKRKPHCPHCGSIDVFLIQRNDYMCKFCKKSFKWEKE